MFLLVYLYSFLLGFCLLHVYLISKSSGSYQQKQYQGFLELFHFYGYETFFTIAFFKLIDVCWSQRSMLIRNWWTFKGVEGRVSKGLYYLEYQLYLLYPNHNELKENIVKSLEINIDTLKFCQTELGYKSILLSKKEVSFYQKTT